ncbi:MAG TPA: hypothetical protein VMF89_35105, partial [Polyangiales bacterium]|nr:hypothetical protein [Polyangiales bacterium]
TMIWALLHGCGILLLGRQRRWPELALLGLPLVTLTLFNWLGAWPLGAFRTNLFLLAYTCPLAAATLDVPRLPQLRLAVPALLLLLLPLLAFERDWHRSKHFVAANCPIWPIVSGLQELQSTAYSGPPEPLVLDAYTCKVWEYYFGLHPQHQRLGEELSRRFVKSCGGFKNLASSNALIDRSAARAHGERVWVALSGAGRASLRLADVESRVELVRQVEPGEAIVLAVSSATSNAPSRDRVRRRPRTAAETSPAERD